MTTTQSLPVIYSTTVLAAQGVKLTPEVDAILTARANHLRTLTGETGLFPVGIAIRDPYTNAHIGSLTYQR